MKKAIINAKLIMTDGIIWDGALVIEDEIITEVGKREEVVIPKDAEIIDANGLYVAPGLIDIHNHGVGKSLFVDDPMSCAEELVKHGVTTVLPTIYNNLSLEQMLDGAEKIEKASKIGVGKIMDGLYMEGPYMCAGLGSFKNQLKWQGDITQDEYMPLLNAVGSKARVWAIDPARDGIEPFMKEVKKAMEINYFE